MRRAIWTAAVAALLAGGATGLPSTALAVNPVVVSTAAADPGATAEWRTQECRYQGVDPEPWAQREVVLTIACAVGKWPVYGGIAKALAVARCESGLNAGASNGGAYLGIYQHAARYWPSRQNTYDPNAWDKELAESAFNARANVVVAIRMAHGSAGWQPWSCA